MQQSTRRSAPRARMSGLPAKRGRSNAGRPARVREASRVQRRGPRSSRSSPRPAPVRSARRPAGRKARAGSAAMPKVLRQNPVVVLGVDFSPATDAALDTAIRTAREHGGRIVIVHAISALGAPGLDVVRPPNRPFRNESADLAASIDANPADRLQRLVREEGLDVELVSRPGQPVDVLVEEAQRLRARAVIVGTHGRSGLARGFLGSVAEGVLQRCDSPVIIVPGDGEPELHAP